LLVQKKVTKVNDTPYRLLLRYTVLWAAIGNSLRSNSRLPKSPINLCLTGAVAGELRKASEVKPYSLIPQFRHSRVGGNPLA